MAESTVNCSRCGFENPAGMRFCGGCGASLAAAPVAAEEERKTVAILFADICDFTALVAAGDAEETKEKIDACLRMMAEQIVAMGGVVEKFIGDAVMAVFGVPVAHENDAERAVRAGMRLLDQIHWFGASAGLNIELRVGIHAGEVIVSAYEGGPGREHAVFGDAVNVAARLEQTGEAGRVLVSVPVFERTRAIFEYEEVPPLKAKGLTEPLRRFRVESERIVRGKIRGLTGLSAPMIGRNSELGWLLSAYDDVLAERGGRVVAVIGEPGIGKTRLVEEFMRSVAGRRDDTKFFRARCLAYAGGTAYAPLITILKEAAGIKDDMTAETARACLADAVTGLLGSDRIGDIAAVNILESALGFQDVGAGGNSEQVRSQVYVIVEKLLASFAARNPLVLMIEDLHWADESTLGLLQHLTRNLAGARCLMILNTRPPVEYGAALQELLAALERVPGYAGIHLRDLNREESRELVSSLLTIEHLQPEARDFIVARSGGNPFFVEEIIKVLIEKGIVVRRGDGWTTTRDIENLDIPDTIEGVLRARFDSLPREQKRTLQRAAVVGQVFWQRIVDELMEECVKPYLQALEKRDLIRQRLESAFDDDLEYMFKHALLHDTVYKSVLRRVRRALHLKVAGWLEEYAPDRRDEYLALLAYHFEMGGERERAAFYYLRAGRRSAALFANEDAKRFYGRAAGLSAEPQSLFDAYLGWAEMCARTDVSDEAVAHYESARAYAATVEADADIIRRIGDIYEKRSQYGPAMEYYQWASEILASASPNLARVKLNHSIAWVMHLRGESARADEYALRAEQELIALGREDVEAERVRSSLFNLWGNIYSEKSDINASRRYYELTRAVHEKLGNLFGVCTVLNNMSINEIHAGRYDEALSLLQHSYDLAGRTGFRFSQAVNCCNFGDSYYDLGAYDRAVEYYGLYLEINAAVGNRLGDGYAYLGLGNVARARGDFGDAQAYTRKSIAIFKELGAARLVWAAKLALTMIQTEAKGYGDGEFSFASFAREGQEGFIMYCELVSAARLARRRPLTDDEKAKVVDLLRRADILNGDVLRAIERFEVAAARTVLYRALGDMSGAVAAAKLARITAAAIRPGVPDGELRRGFDERIARELPLIAD